MEDKENVTISRSLLKIRESNQEQDSLGSAISLIRTNYKIHFIVEQVIVGGKKTIYRLKRRRTFSLWRMFEDTKYPSKNEGKYVDEYETNELGNRINFSNTEEIDRYLRLQFSEPEGFVTDFFDLK